MNHLLVCFVSITFGSSILVGATVSLPSGTYTENFDAIATSAADGWDVRTGATATSLGTIGSYTTTATAWGNTSGNFKNVAAVGSLASSADATAQSSATDRALGIRQIGSFGDPSASFNFNFSSTGLSVSSITIDLQMLSVQERSTSWSLQYGIGSSPSSFATLATYTDPGTFGSTTLQFTPTDFGTNLNNQSDVWFRIVALSASTGANSRDTFGIDNFSITAVPETSTALLGLLSVIGLLRRRR